MFAKDYRRLAWGHMQGNWGVLIITYLIYAVITGLLSSTGIGTLLVAGPFAVGLASVSLTLIRTGKAKVETMFEGFTSNFATNLVAYILQGLFVALWSLLFVIPGIIKGYSYAMTYYILRDNPDIGATEAITRSRKMMKGHKWQLFCLQFSFFGWILLSALTFGILMLWVTPYMQVATAEFYESIKGESASEQNDQPEQQQPVEQIESI